MTLADAARARLLAGALLVLAAVLAAPASAGAPRLDPQNRAERSQVEVTAATVWPEFLRKGYFPIRVELANEDGREHVVTVTASIDPDPRQPGNRVERTVELAAGERLAFDLLAPCFGTQRSFGGPFGSYSFFYGWEAYDVRAVVDGRDFLYLGAVGSLGDTGSATPVDCVLVVTDQPVSTGELGLWNERLALAKHDAGGRQFADVSLRSVTGLEAPARYEPYTSLDLVVVQAEGEPPPAAVLEALATHARLGGIVAVVGRGASALVRDTPALAAWTEERFRLEGHSLDTFAAGFGLLVIDPRPFLGGEGELDERQRDALRQLVLEHELPRVPARASTRGRWLPDIPGFGQLPYRSLTLILVLFAIVIGPVNFLVLKASGKQVMLLVTIPLIALVVTAAVVGYGLFHQGLDVKSASLSVALLDQRAHHASILELRSFYAGLSPAPGLRPEAGTSVHADGHAGGERVGAGYHVQGELLRGDFLPVRWPARQTLLGDRAARGRLLLARSEEGLRAENGLGARIELLLVHDAAGEEHVAPDGVAAGGEALLESEVDLWLSEYDATLATAAPAGPPTAPASAPGSPLAELFQELGPGEGGRSFFPGIELEAGHRRTLVRRLREHLLPGTYAALLAAPVLQDPLGIGGREVAGRHWIVGVLAPEDVR